MRFKDRLVQLRKDMNLTQEGLAERLGYSRTAISAWEIGRNEPSYADIIKIADFFRVSIDYLLGKEDTVKLLAEANIAIKEKLKNKKNSIPDSDIDIAFYEGYKGLHEEDKEVMRSTLEAFLKKNKKK